MQQKEASKFKDISASSKLKDMRLSLCRLMANDMQMN